MNHPVFLAADIGATKTNICLYTFPGRLVAYSPPVQFRTADFSGIEALVAQFLGSRKLDLCFCVLGVPGPVDNGRAHITNLPWVLDEKKIQSELNLRTVRIVNDLEATAYALTELKFKDIFTLSAGKKKGKGNKAILAPGSGLGESFLTWDGATYASFASEGGHGDFAPNSKIECDLFEYLQKKYGHVSYERVCSGQGIYNIYRFLKDQNHEKEPAWLTKEFKSAGTDPVPLIIETALNTERECLICVKTIMIFSVILGAEAGNLGLRVLAKSGVYLGGGLSAKVLPFLKEKAFVQAYYQKGRMSGLIKEIPLHVITIPTAGLIGAALYGVVHYLSDCQKGKSGNV
ncbi:MAG: glucokinase [Desulfobacter sp.]|nr:MAG: glucokinase [Desulfobacter sp.]